MSPIRVVQFINSLDVADGGPARNSLETNTALNTLAGVPASIRVVKPSTGTSVVDEAAVRATRVGLEAPIECGRGLSQFAQFWRGSWGSVRSSDVVVVHGYFLWWVPMLVAASRAARKPVVLVPHGSLTEYQRQRGVAKKFVFHILAGRWLQRLVSAWAVGTEFERGQLPRRAQARTKVVGVGTMPPQPRREPTWGQPPVECLVLGRIAPKKRIDLAIEAVAELRRRGMEVALTIAGDGEAGLVRALHDRVEAEGLREAVAFVGEVRGEAKEAVFDRKHMFLMPSDDENFGIALAEALVRGLPAVVGAGVAAAALAPPDAVSVVHEQTPDAYVTAMERWLLNPGELERSARVAGARASAVYGWHPVAVRWRELLFDLAAPSTSPTGLSRR